MKKSKFCWLLIIVLAMLPVSDIQAKSLGFRWENKYSTVYFYCGFNSTWKNAISAGMESWNEVKDISSKSTIVPMKINNDSSNLNRICIAQNEKEIARIYPKYTNGILDWVMVVFNTGDYSFTSSGTSGSFDIQSIATHELGHAIGVAHCHEIGESCNSSTCSSNIMNPTIKENTIRRTLTDYDKSSKRVNYLN